MSFWKRIDKKTFFCLAPMADVTDCAFRRLIAKYGKPDVMWTEFVSANGLMSGGREILKRDLVYSEEERPIVAQLFSSDPINMEGAAKLAAEMGFDGIDINMGCPDKTIEKQGAGASMIKNPEIALQIIEAAQRGIKLSGRSIPLSVKTRIGYNQPQIDSWIRLLLKSDIAALTVHARTRKDMSKVPADWSYIKEVVKLRNELAPNILIIGNGDVVSLNDGLKKAKETGCDGIMVGRALFGNPWFFDEKRQIEATLPKRSPKILRNLPVIGKYFDTRRRAPVSKISPISIKEKLEVLVEHSRLFDKMLGDIKSFSILKKHYKAYCTGFNGAKELRIKLMESRNIVEVESHIKEFLLQ